MIIEKRNLKITFNKSGKYSIVNRVTLPTTWIKAIGITLDDRNVEVVLNEDNSITIKKI